MPHLPQDASLNKLMRPNRRLTRESRISWPLALLGKRGYLLAACLSLALLYIQISHPALHPHEVINPAADAQHACPLSHAATAYLIAPPLLVGAGPSLSCPPDPLPWFGHARFVYPLAARPPPAYLYY
jgi:hypothetical protein